MKDIIVFKQTLIKEQPTQLPKIKTVEITSKEAEEMMRHDSYRRVRGAVRQVGHGN